MRKKAKRRPRQDSDSPWKELLVKHFERCLFYFFRDIHVLIDWPRGFEFLDKEFRSISRRAKSGKRCVDILVRVHLKDGTDPHILIHVEVQSRRDPNLPPRMYVYHYRAYDLNGVPVISLAILADLDPDWRPDHFGYEHAWKGRPLHVPRLQAHRFSRTGRRAEDEQRSVCASHFGDFENARHH